MTDLPNLAIKVFANARNIAMCDIVSSRDVIESLKMFMNETMAIKISKDVTKLSRYNKNREITTRDILTSLRLNSH